MAAAQPMEALKALNSQAIHHWIEHREGQGAGLATICGVAPAQLYAQLPELRHLLRQRQRVLLTLDGAGVLCPQRTFSQVVEAYVQEVERLGAMTEDIGELLSWMHLQDRWRGLGQPQLEVPLSPLDTTGRLWQLLSQAAPAILLVFHPEQCSPHALEQLDYLARYYYSDPIAELAPEYGGQSRARGMIALISATRQLPVSLSVPPSATLDVYEHAEHHVREYLTRPDVIARLIESTQGDLSRLDDLIVDLGQNIHLLSRHRYLQLEGAQSTLVDMLAMAEQPLEMALAQRALHAQQISQPLPALMRGLMESGLLARQVKTGAVYVMLRDRQLGQAIQDRMPSAQRARHFAALCEAALESGHDQDLERATRWALQGQRLDVVRRLGVQAAQQLLARGELQSALALLDQMVEALDSTLDEILLAQLIALQVELATRLGRYRRALEYSERLEDKVVGLKGRAELTCRQARLLMRVNEHALAIERLDALVGALRDEAPGSALLARALALLAEAAYDRGDHERSGLIAQEVAALLDALEQSVAASTRSRDLALAQLRLQSRNLSGKVAIFFGRFDEARALFAQNLQDAQRLDLSDEQARARGNLGVVAMCVKDYDEALVCLKDAVAYQPASEIIPRARLLLNLGVIYQHRFEYEQALKHYLEAMRVARQNEQARIYAISAYNLATLYRDIGALERAERVMAHLMQSPLSNEEVAPMLVTWALSLKINIAAQRGDFAQVIASAAELEIDSPRTKDARLATTAMMIALAYVERGDWASAREIMTQAAALDGYHSPLAQARQATVLARLAMLSGDLAQAEREALVAVSRWARYGHFLEGLHAELILTEILRLQGRAPEAHARLERLVRDLEDHQARIPAALRDGARHLWTVAQLVEQLRAASLPVPSALAPQSASGSPILMERTEAAWRAWRRRYEAIVGDSPRLHQIFRVLDRVAASATPLLILGESGTGKELIAQATHERSDRSHGPFIKVNCAAFVENLLMSELFGHEKGAFTGAVAQKIGRFELADGGTLFLDEIADISMQTQVALLRVLQEQEFERVGGTQTLRVEVRLICATNKNLEEMVQRGEFRLDLYYRLKGMIIELPSLRERREDIPLLVESFTRRFTPQGLEPKRYEAEVMRRLIAYSWPGNVRELQNFVRSVLLFVEGDHVRLEHLREMEDFFLGGSFEPLTPSLEQMLPSRWSWSQAAADPTSGLATPGVASSDALTRPHAQAASPGEPAGDSRVSSAQPRALEPQALTEAMIQQILNQEVCLHDLKKVLEVESIRRAILETDGNVTQAAKILQMKRPRLSQIINSTPELSSLKERLVQ